MLKKLIALFFIPQSQGDHQKKLEEEVFPTLDARYVTRPEFSRDLAIVQARIEAMVIASIRGSSEEHLNEIKGNQDTIQDPAEKANVAQFIRQAELWHEHLNLIEEDLAKRAECLAEDINKS